MAHAAQKMIPLVNYGVHVISMGFLLEVSFASAAGLANGKQTCAWLGQIPAVKVSMMSSVHSQGMQAVIGLP